MNLGVIRVKAVYLYAVVTQKKVYLYLYINKNREIEMFNDKENSVL